MTQILFIVTGLLIALPLALLLKASVDERQHRAAWVAAALLVVVLALWLFVLIWLREVVPLQLGIAAGVALLAALFFVPWHRSRGLEIEEITERVDERDVIFAREEYRPGSEHHDAYYAMRPENLAVDDRIRRLPPLLAPGGRLYDAQASAEIGALFRIIEAQLTEVDGPIDGPPRPIDPAAMTAAIKSMVLRMGAVEVGVARLNPMYVYSHVGRGPEVWGEPIENPHAFAVAFTLEMRTSHVSAAPNPAITKETVVQYLRGAQISIAMARFIRSFGYPARAHIAGSNYQIMLPPVAHDAGLGELGRLGYLISPVLGARVRLGALTTDLPLIPDEPITFGVQEFCEKCRKCATNCPSGAIPRGSKTVERGVQKWQLNIEQCLHYWRVIGTDCGMCMKVCPYSHPPTLIHNLVRAGIKRSPVARTLSLWGDDLFYGRKLV